MSGHPWLQCRVSPGQFTNEYAVAGTLLDGNAFSLFAATDDVRLMNEVSETSPVDGLLRVVVLNHDDDAILVRLPQPSFENGQTVTVSKKSITESVR